MVSTILGALLPMLLTFLLGFFAAWRRDFGPNDASTLNRMVLVYAVPLALFAGTVTTSRAALVQDVSLVRCAPLSLACMARCSSCAVLFFIFNQAGVRWRR
jgi:predicted permease